MEKRPTKTELLLIESNYNLTKALDQALSENLRLKKTIEELKLAKLN